MTTLISKYILKHSISEKDFNRHPHNVCDTGCLVKCRPAMICKTFLINIARERAGAASKGGLS